MSEEQLKVFLDKAKADTSLQKKLNAAASLETAIEIAQEAGFEITVEDIKSMQSAWVKLSDAELEEAVGGLCIWPVSGYILWNHFLRVVG